MKMTLIEIVEIALSSIIKAAVWLISLSWCLIVGGFFAFFTPYVFLSELNPVNSSTPDELIMSVLAALVLTFAIPFGVILLCMACVVLVFPFSATIRDRWF